MRGPSHMALALPEERLVGWLATPNPNPNPHPHPNRNPNPNPIPDPHPNPNPNPDTYLTLTLTRSVAPGTPPPRRSSLAPNERLTFAFCTSEAPLLDI